MKLTKNQTDEETKQVKEKIKYLGDKEFEELNEFCGKGGFLQYVFGLESCKTRGDVVEMIEEIFDKGYNKALDEVEKIIGEMEVEHNDYCRHKPQRQCEKHSEKQSVSQSVVQDKTADSPSGEVSAEEIERITRELICICDINPDGVWTHNDLHNAIKIAFKKGYDKANAEFEEKITLYKNKLESLHQDDFLGQPISECSSVICGIKESWKSFNEVFKQEGENK